MPHSALFDTTRTSNCPEIRTLVYRNNNSIRYDWDVSSLVLSVLQKRVRLISRRVREGASCLGKGASKTAGARG